jgi:hypothetical protein
MKFPINAIDPPKRTMIRDENEEKHPSIQVTRVDKLNIPISGDDRIFRMLHCCTAAIRFLLLTAACFPVFEARH